MCEKALPLEIPMKLLLTLATSFALVSLVHSQEDYHHPDKDQAIRAVEQHLSARFVKEGVSSDGRSVRWEFLFSPYHGIPVVIDLIAFYGRADGSSFCSSVHGGPNRLPLVKRYKTFGST
jgi:hypothetical protein